MGSAAHPEFDAGGNECAMREILKNERSGQFVVNPVARTGGKIR
jgi:hypothetical protein